MIAVLPHVENCFQHTLSSHGHILLCDDIGNFYLTWAPGQTTWQPHNRPAARRVQSMGWTPASELWLSVRGGDLFINDKSGPASEAFSQAKLGSRGFGILDVG